jgi:hypothetical protein
MLKYLSKLIKLILKLKEKVKDKDIPVTGRGGICRDVGIT